MLVQSGPWGLAELQLAVAVLLIRDKNAAKLAHSTPSDWFSRWLLATIISGIKRHIALDTQGLPHAVQITTAEVTDRKGALQAMQRCQSNLSRVRCVLTDSRYTGKPFAQGVQQVPGKYVRLEVVKCSEMHTFVTIPRRWLVERNFA